MKICPHPKCGKLHNKSGIYCSRSCANSRNFSIESRKLKSIKSKQLDNSHLHQPDVQKKAIETKKKKRLEKIKFGNWEDLSLAHKRERVLIEQNYQCSECDLGTEWNGKPLMLELDHIDGDSSNNERENLRFLCPNCHQQTPTYKGRHRKQKGLRYTDEQIIEALHKNVSGYSAMRSIGMNPHGGNYVRIRNIIKKHNLKLSYTV
ncbi:hypothetical protein LCGC14_1235300 [marine sediment metagenome]|uniref:HNH nuclease domain-containing protein n=1 Tax=marine sediment metagenome TaxID=412755 RepID=A0A0F9LBM7_9ZZZZ